MASIKKFKKINSKDRDLSQVQQNVEEVLTPVLNAQIVDGVLIKDVCLVALRPNLVTHKLNRPAFGWIVVRKRGDSRIWDIQDDSASNDTIALTCSHNVTVDLWVF